MGNIVQLTPPLTVSPDEFDRATAILDKSLADVAQALARGSALAS
jgi:4-aminobutyrate aminotransferase-like enzyme